MIKEQFIHELTIGTEVMGIQLDELAKSRLFIYYTELERWNRKVNLVSRRPHDWIRIHFLDSLAPLTLGLLGEGGRVVDLGAGAGFPGMPLKIARESVSLSMAEASGKKCTWLKHLI